MPRVKLAGYSYKDKALTELIRARKYALGFTNEALAKKIGISRCKLIDLIANPSKGRLVELRDLLNILGISKEAKELLV